MELHGLDTETQVLYYEQDFYVLSSFAAFRLSWCGRDFDTLEQAYHWLKFPHDCQVRLAIENARSAHEAFKIAEANKDLRRSDWDEIKVDVMKNLARAKAEQHEYVRRKLLASDDRELIENSWRDGFWGWGPDGDGLNQHGKIWMEIRAELRTK